MRKRWVFALSVTALTVTAVLIWLWINVPFYRGRPVFYWRAKVYEWVHPVPSDAARQPFELAPAPGVAPDPAGIPVLVALLDDKDALVGAFACNALAIHGAMSAPAVPALRKMLRDEDVYERRNGVKTLGAIGPNARAAIPDLIEALKDEDSFVNYFAAVALGKIGIEAREAIPALRELRQSDRTKVSYLGLGEESSLMRGTDKVGYAVDRALKEICPEEAGELNR
jgi:HEAT repeat protein